VNPIKAIPYWIQRADFSMTAHGPVGLTDGVRAFEMHDWRHELESYSKLESAGTECCPPGIGFVGPAGDILHICPSENGRVVVHYHFTGTRKLLGFVRVPRTIVETRPEMHRSVVSELIGFFFEGRHEWMLEKLGTV